MERAGVLRHRWANPRGRDSGKRRSQLGEGGLEVFDNGGRGDGRHRRKPEGGVNGKFTNQSSRWEASEMDHSPRASNRESASQWRSRARPTWTGIPKGEHAG